MSPRHNTDAIKGVLRVSDYCRATGIELKKSGAEMRAACPLPECGVSGRRPFAVDSEDTGWRCNACDVGGDVIRLILCLEFDGAEGKMSDAIARAAELANLDSLDGAELKKIAAAAREREVEAKARKVAERRTATINAVEYWHSCKMRDPEGEAYMERRGVLKARQEVRFRGPWICLPLYDEAGKIINVVRRRFRNMDDGPKLISLKNCGTIGTFGKISDAEHTTGPVIEVEGVFDYLSARVLCPSQLTLGAHGAARWPDVARASASIARDRGLVLVPHLSDINHIGSIRCAKAIAAARSVGILDVRRMEIERGDLNDFLLAGGDGAMVLASPSVDEPGARRVFARTDLGNAERYAATHGDRLKYVADTDVWRLWDGKRWDIAHKKTNLVQAAAEVCEDMLRDAHRDDDADAARYAISVQSQRKINSMISLAAARHEVAAKRAEFDQRRDLFNCSNGVIDLRTGALLPHDPGYRITQCSPIPYEYDAKAPRWKKFLAEVFEPNPEDSGFLQRFAGYSLTGETNAQCAIFMHGDGANGKGTICRILAQVMGDLAGTLPMDLFRDDEIKRITPEYWFGKLQGRHAAMVSEGKRGDRLDTAVFKTLTGEDIVPARFPAGIPFELASRAKLWFAMNDLPHIEPGDAPTWRRILLLPHLMNFRDRMDPTLEPALLQELPGILVWMVRGARDWYDMGEGIQGLGETDSMREAKRIYRAFTDDFGVFLSEECARRDKFPEGSRDSIRTECGQLYKRYTQWARRGGIADVWSMKAVGAEMKKRGLKAFRAGSTRFYPVGLRAREGK